jgi:hypothetical protein
MIRRRRFRGRPGPVVSREMTPGHDLGNSVLRSREMPEKFSRKMLSHRKESYTAFAYFSWSRARTTMNPNIFGRCFDEPFTPGISSDNVYNSKAISPGHEQDTQ